MKKNLVKKTIMLIASLAVLIAAGIYATTAWFTKTTSVDALTFDVAQWDFSAAYVTDSAQLSVHTFSNMAGQKAAPGTNGYIDIVIDATQSDVNLKLTLTVDESTMSQEFQDRLVFYHGTDWNHKVEFRNAADGYIVTATHGQKTTIRLFWSWYYEMKNFKSDASAEEQEAWDEFDTKVGKNPELYENDMSATVRISATQEKPN